MPDDVLLDEVLQEALVQVVHDRRAQRQQLAGQPLHLLGHLEPPDAVAHQRLVHVEVEQAHLGVGHLGQRLAVDAHELQEGDEREAGCEHGGDVAQELEVVLGHEAWSPEGKPIDCQMRSIRAGSSPVSRAASSNVYSPSSDGNRSSM